MTTTKLTKQQALEALLALKDYYESTGQTFIFCAEDKENDGAWLFFNRLQQGETKKLVHTVNFNVNLFFSSEEKEIRS